MLGRADEARAYLDAYDQLAVPTFFEPQFRDVRYT